MEPGNRNEIEVMETDVEDDGIENGVTREAQQQKCENPTPNTDTTNDSIYSLSAIGDNDDDKNNNNNDINETKRRYEEKCVQTLAMAVSAMIEVVEGMKSVLKAIDDDRKKREEKATKSQIQREKVERKS